MTTARLATPRTLPSAGQRSARANHRLVRRADPPSGPAISRAVSIEAQDAAVLHDLVTAVATKISTLLAQDDVDAVVVSGLMADVQASQRGGRMYIQTGNPALFDGLKAYYRNATRVRVTYTAKSRRPAR